MTKFMMSIVLVSGMAFGQGPEGGAKPADVAPKALVGSVAARPDWPRAKQSDVDSVEHIVAAVYDVISGAAGQPRDWNRMRSLFVPDARLMPIQPARDGTGADVTMLTIDEYITRASARTTTNGFFERSVHNEVESFGDLAQIWSTYESRHALADTAPFARGINSFQLMKDGTRYWVVGILWSAERPGSAIPQRYLGEK